MPRSAITTVNGKQINLKELRICELEELFDKIGSSVDDVVKSDTTTDIKAAVFKLLYDKLPLIEPAITEGDIKNAYPSEIEEYVSKFVDVNFHGIKSLAGPVMSLLQAGLMKK